MAMTGHRRLLAAVLIRATEDALGTDPEMAAEARRWLRMAGADLAEQLDVLPERVAAWVGELPDLPYEQLMLFD